MADRVIRALLVAVGVASLGATPGDDRTYQEAMRHYRSGQQHLLTEAWDEAETEFRAAIALEPHLAPAHYGLGQVFMATKRYEDAVRAYIACREAYRVTEANLRLDRAEGERRVQEQIKGLEEHIRALGSGRVQTRNTSSTLVRLGDQLNDLKRLKSRSATAPSHTPPGVSLALGSAYFRSNAFADAEREYLAALEVDPTMGEAHNNLAVVYMLTNRLDQARTELQAAEKSGFKVNPKLKQDIEARAH